MHTILLYPNGRRVNGIILSASEDIMRVAVQRRADIVELRRVGGVWISENGSSIQFEALVIAGNTGFCGYVAPKTETRTLTAGQSFLT